MASESGSVGARPKRSAQKIIDYKQFAETGRTEDVSEQVGMSELFSPVKAGKVMLRSTENAAIGDENKNETAGMLGREEPFYSVEDEDSETELDSLRRELEEVESVKQKLERQKEKYLLKEKLERSKKDVERLRKEDKRVIDT